MHKFKIFILTFSALIVSVCSVMASAQVKHQLNVAEVPVADQSAQVLSSVLPKAFAQVLVKMSGNSSVMTLPAIQNELPQVEELVRSYRYRTVKEAAGASHLIVQVTFDRRGIENLLRQAGQAIWSTHRPKVLVWVHIKKPQRNYVLASGAKNDLTHALRQAMNRRGIPYLLPTMDLQDQTFRNINPTQAFDPEKLKRAAKRYDVKVVMAGDLTEQSATTWQGHWLLLLDAEPFKWAETAVTPQQLLSEGMKKMANLMANQLAVIDNHSLRSAVTLEVFDVNDLSAYVSVVRYLKNLAPVTAVAVNDLQGSQLFLTVNTVGGQRELINALRSSSRLLVVPEPFQSANNGVDLYYRWN